MGNNIKDRIEHVLGTKIHDEQVQYIQTYYSSFYENPEEFVGDNLLTMIREDLNISEPKNILEYVKALSGTSNLHMDSYETLAWGRYHDQDFYALMVKDVADLEWIHNCETDMFIDKNSSDDTLICTTAIAEDGKSAVVFVQTRAAIAAIGELPFTVCQVPGYHKGNIFRLFSGDIISAQFYVPFIPANTGRNPILWKDHTGSAPSSNTTLGELWESETDPSVVVDSDTIKIVYGKMKQIIGKADLEIGEDRYEALGFCGCNMIYNRNHLAYNGNLSAACAMAACVAIDIQGLDNVCTNLYEVGNNGTTEAWDMLFYSTKSGSSDVTSSKAPGNLEYGHVTESGAIGQIGRDRGEGNAKTTLGKLFQNASSDYKQV